jgi:uncharacterized protein (TIGR03067 family)
VTHCILLALACGMLLAADNQDAANKDHARLEGVWSFALVEVEGKKQPDAPFETNKLIVTKDGSYVIVQGPRITHGTLKLDPAKSPKHYDVMITSGPVKGLTALGIYEIDGETFKICLPLASKERPTAFVSKAGSGLMIHVFKQEQKDPTTALIDVARQELAGTWQSLTYALDGKKASDEDMKKLKLLFDATGKATATNEGKVFIAATTKINPAAKPMAIDMNFTEGDFKGQTSQGIYKIEDDVLTICRAAAGKARPTEFASEAGSGQTLMTYRRVKD